MFRAVALTLRATQPMSRGKGLSQIMAPVDIPRLSKAGWLRDK